MIIMTIFWDCEGVFLVNFLPCGTTINSPYHASLLHRLRSSILKKRRRKLRRSVLLLHDNASVHKSNIAQTSIQYTGFTESNHSTDSPGLAPSDYHLFPNVKNSFRGRNFETDDEVIMTLNHYSKNLDSDFFSKSYKVYVLDGLV